MKLIKLETTVDFNVYFASDFHLNHEGPRGGTPLWQSRGYKSPLDMTDGIIAKVNEVVKPTDYLFYLGDFCLNTSREQFSNNLARINCQNIHMLWGNHNSRVKDLYQSEVYAQYGTNDIEVYPLRVRNIIFCGHYLEIIVNGTYLCLCHYPIDVFNEMRHGAYMLCGHSHYGYEKTRASNTENRRLDMSWDGHMKPLSFDEVKAIMDKKKLVGLDHHGKD